MEIKVKKPEVLRFEQKISADKNPGRGQKSAKKQGLKVIL
jgi:hypothetical protein